MLHILFASITCKVCAKTEAAIQMNGWKYKMGLKKVVSGENATPQK